MVKQRNGKRRLGARGGLAALLVPLLLGLAPSAHAEIVAFETNLDPAPGPSSLAAETPLNEADTRMLAATIWAEARSEGEVGMRAVAHVIVNRIGARFGDNVENVILAPWQFSAWNARDPNRPLVENPDVYATAGGNLVAWETAQRIAREVLLGQSNDPTGGALFYHARSVHPRWARFGDGRRIIGAHAFYRDVRDGSRRRAQVIDVSEAFDEGLPIEEAERDQDSASAP
ncbi:MAG: cell wall hydrolase [Terricaulis sp.]